MGSLAGLSRDITQPKHAWLRDVGTWHARTAFSSDHHGSYPDKYYQGWGRLKVVNFILFYASIKEIRK